MRTKTAQICHHVKRVDLFHDHISNYKSRVAQLIGRRLEFVKLCGFSVVSFCERPLHCKDFLWRFGQFGRVQSFVRPVDCGHYDRWP
jgi:hypothetical protein